jgi:hypothetical protein
MGQLLRMPNTPIMNAAQSWSRPSAPSWNKVILDALKDDELPNLSGSKLVVWTDSRFVGEFWTDSIICSNERYLTAWNMQRLGIRERHLLDAKGLHYTDLHPDVDSWDAIEPSLKVANRLPGVCLVTMTPKSMADVAAEKMQAALVNARRDGRLRHRWKAMEFMKTCQLCNMVTLVAGTLSVPGQAFHWLSDNEPIFGNKKQLEDLQFILRNSESMNIPHQLGQRSISTNALSDESTHFANDLVALCDLTAAAVSDTLMSVDLSVEAEHVAWNAQKTPTAKDQKVSAIGGWYWNMKGAALRRYAFHLSYDRSATLSISRFAPDLN